MRLDLGPDTATAPNLRFAGTPVLTYRRQGRWMALLGVPLDSTPGWLSAELVRSDGGVTAIPFVVREHLYPTQHLKVRNRRHVEPSAEELARYERERALQDAAKKRWRAVEMAEPRLHLPVRGRRSSAFGLRRTFNGEPRAPHGGLDLAVPLGTPLGSPGDGVVTLTGDYFFNGQTVFVDHGQGLISMLCHLSRTDVREGQTLARGQRIGLAGATGRATGPHVHWSVFLNGTAVDPEDLLARP